MNILQHLASNNPNTGFQVCTLKANLIPEAAACRAKQEANGQRQML